MNKTLCQTHDLLLPRLLSGEAELALDTKNHNHPGAR